MTPRTEQDRARRTKHVLQRFSFLSPPNHLLELGVVVGRVPSRSSCPPIELLDHPAQLMVRLSDTLGRWSQPFDERWRDRRPKE